MREKLAPGKCCVLVRDYLGILRRKAAQKDLHFNEIIWTVGWMKDGEELKLKAGRSIGK